MIELASLSWNRNPINTHNKDLFEVQNDWNQTLLTVINQAYRSITNSYIQFRYKKPTLIVHPNVENFISSLYYYDEMKRMISSRYCVEFSNKIKSDTLELNDGEYSIVIIITDLPTNYDLLVNQDLKSYNENITNYISE